MPVEDAKRRIVHYEAHIAAIGCLRYKKSQLAIKSALWRNIYQAQYDTAILERDVARKEQAMRDIIIVAVTGVFACIGSFVVTSMLARAAGTAYVTGSMATPVALAASTVTIPTGTTLTIVGMQRIGQTATQWIATQILQTILVRAPVGALLTRTVGSSALSRVYELISGQFNRVQYSDSDFQALRDVLASRSTGEERYQRVIADSAARRDELLPAMAQAMRELVAEYVGEAVIGVEPPLNGLLLMSDGELAAWYGQFRDGVDGYISKQYASWSREDRNILRNSLYWDFWNDIQVKLNELDRKWHGDIQVLNKAISDARFDIMSAQLPGAR